MSKSEQYRRFIFNSLIDRLQERRLFMQVLAGPRQTGKTTLARQAIESIDFPAHYASADEPLLRDRSWIEEQWDVARLSAKGGKKALLFLDEVQKIPFWSDTVKRLWDEDSAKKVPLRVVLLGSAQLLIQRVLTESLAGRFEVIHVPHWGYKEMRDAFGWSLEEYVFFGGYPGSAPLIKDSERWSRYIIDSLIETTISRDIFHMTRVDKPALLRRLFHLGCEYSGQVLSYQKMLGQLQDVSNTTTLAHYLDLLSGAGMITGLQKFAGQRVRQRGSSPKLQVLNTALMTALLSVTFQEAQKDRALWGRLVESAIGAHLINGATGTKIGVYYWREFNREVDFVLASNRKIVAIEVKSGKAREALPGMDAFSKAFTPARKLLIGGQGMAIEEFLRTPVQELI
ncbi:MAG: ATP-binding protein [Nitrospirae bacterium]|nr:ATP-binding protein [Nitrospirota bacterium]